MPPAPDAYHQLERNFAEWALTQPAIRAVIVIGSQARSDHAADEWSDLDLVAFASETDLYLHDAAWLSVFGNVIAAYSDSFGENDREWIALYADGCKLDIGLLSIDPAAAPTLQAALDRFPYPTVLQRGVRVLIDKSDVPTELRLPPLELPRPPSAAEFNALINHLWLDALRAAKFLHRSDLWRAKQLCDGVLKQHLLTLLEWQAAAHKDQRDSWYDGRFLSEWADREALKAVPGTFAAYAAEDLARALYATLDLGRRLARDVATQLGYAYSAEADRFVDAQIGALLRGLT